MGSPTTIHPFPELRALAEEEARAFAEACSDAFALHMGDDTPAMYELGWDGMHDDEQEALTAAHLTLLCDLTRPASRDAVARLVAARVGMPCGATAPGFYWMPGQPGSRDRDGAPEGDDWPPGWWLSNELGDLLFFTGADWCPDDHTEIAGLPDGNERAIEALTLIVRHLWPEESPDAR